MIDLYKDLAWLPRPLEDFTQRCRELGSSAGAGADSLGSRIRTLAAFGLGESQLVRLARQITAAQGRAASLAPLTPFRLGLIGNGTLDLLVAPLIATAARHGIALECVTAGFDQVMQEALSPDSTINAARPDAVLVALDYRGLMLPESAADATAAQQTVDAAVGQLAAIRAGIRRGCGALCIVQTLAPPPEALFGHLDRGVVGSLRFTIDRINRVLGADIAGSDDVLFDVAALAETVGLAHWHSPAQWNLAKLPFDASYVPLYADHVGRLLGALRGKSRRCLILDLDNTVWGGVIGDDGLEGIKLAQGDATGEAHLSVQRMALALRDRGIVLAVSSKNDDGVARTPFHSHPEMLLKEHHIAVFQANWNDKATNIKAIADELSLGLDAMVFLDDNPAERGLVRQMLPQVAVPELPDDPALYARTLSTAGYFEAITFSDEDRHRASFYETNARRVTLQKQVGDLDAYLASLGMTITFQPFDPAGRARIAQLISKSNQFNLTTRRYTEAEVGEMEQRSDGLTLQVRLTDSFGDNGMISVIICRPRQSAVWEIDTWLMSCRVLGRRVETAVLAELVTQARARGVRTLVGVYHPTDRNGMVRDHYAKLGFSPAGEHDGGVEWTFDTAADVPQVPMTVRHAGFAMAAA